MKLSCTHNYYLLLDDESLFCVYGDCHTSSHILGMPYYLPTTRLHEDLANGPRLEHAKVAYTKLQNPINNPVFDCLVRDPARYRRLSADTALVWANLACIVQVKSPYSAMRAYLKVAPPEDSVARVMTKARAFNKSLAMRIGLTGSRMLFGRTVPQTSDIDLVIYGSDTPQIMKAFCEELIVHHGYERMHGNRYLDYVRRRSHRYAGLGNDRELLLKRRWDILVDPEGQSLDLSFAGRRTKVRWFQWTDLRRRAIVESKIVEDHDSFFSPSLLTIKHPRLKTICLLNRGYACLLHRGDFISAHGRLFRTEANDTVLVIDEAAGDTINLTKTPIEC